MSPLPSGSFLSPFVFAALAGACFILGCSSKNTGATDASIPTFGPQITLTPNIGTVYDLASDGHDVYGVTQAGIVKVPVSGGTPTTLVTFSMHEEGIQLALGGSRVFWSERFYSSAVNGTSILNVPVAGGTVSTIETIPNQGFFGAVAVDGSELYWAGVTPSGSCLMPPCPTVNATPLSGGAPTVLSTDAHGATCFAFDASTVYWGTSDAHIMKVPKSGGTTTTLADYSSSYATGLGLVGATLYWASSTGDVFATPTAGGKSKAIEVGLDRILAAVTESTGIYWIGTAPVDAYSGAGVLAWTPLDGSPTKSVWTLPGRSASAMAMDDVNLYFALPTGELIKQSR